MGMFGEHINQMATDELCTLIQKESFIGWIYSLDYDNALVVTNDTEIIDITIKTVNNNEITLFFIHFPP